MTDNSRNNQNIRPAVRNGGSVQKRPSANGSAQRTQSRPQTGTAQRKRRPVGRRQEKNTKPDNTLVSSIVKALIYIVCILIISGIMAFFIITRANDAFAFVKAERTATITVSDDTTVEELAQMLKDNGIINYPSFFELYTKIRGKRTTYAEGVYTIDSSMSYDTLIWTCAGSVTSTRTTVVVTIPEGYTVKEIVSLITTKYALSTEEELYDVIQNYPFDFWFVEELDELPETSTYKKDRTYRLEGYLYPDTYYYYSDASAKTIIYKMLNNFEAKLKKTFGDEYRSEIQRLCKEKGYTFDELIIIASMIQMEGMYDYDYGGISSVFHNRLNNPTVTYGLLGSDATVQYILEKRTAELTQEQLDTDSPYNTRKYRGLPPGPISNPTYLAINYAFYPDDTSYYYFVSQSNGTTLFASTYEEHLENVASVNAGIIIDTSDDPEE